MFKKFTQDENVSSTVQLKATIGKGIKAKLQEQMPNIIPLMPVLFPKRAPLYMVKCKERISILAVDGEILFFQHYDGPWYPTLRLLHKYPNLLPHYQVDRGAIKFVLAGAHIMCPGLTSPGAKMEDVGAESAVAIMAEDKQHALGIGLTKMSTQDILKINKDIGVESVTYLNDGLWHLDTKKLAIHN